MFNLRFFSSLLFCLFVHLLTFAQPANDDCSGATLITTNVECKEVSSSLKDATPSNPPASNSDEDIWFTFIAATTQSYITITASDPLFKPNYEIYSGSCGSLTSIKKGTNTSSTGIIDVISGLTIGNTYFYRVYNNGGSISNYSFQTCVQDFKNDECTGAINLIPQTEFSFTTGLNYQASKSTGFTSNCSSITNTKPDVWYTFKATSPTHFVFVQATNNSTDYAAGFEVFSGSCGLLTSIKCKISTSNKDSLKLTGLLDQKDYFIRIINNKSSNPSVYHDVLIATPPENDDCNKAKNLTSNQFLCKSSEDLITNFATQSLAGVTGMGTADDDVWFSFTADTSAQFITVTPSKDYTPVIQIFEDGCPPTVATSKFQTKFTGTKGAEGKVLVTGLTKTKKYYFRVYDSASKNDNLLSVTACISRPPYNDDCLSSKLLTMNNYCKTTDGDGTNATPSSLVAKVSGANAEDDLWYSFKPTNTKGFITVNASFMYRPVIEVFDACSSTTPIITQQFSAGASGTINLPILDPTKTYFYRIYDSGTGNPGSMTFSTCVTSATSNDECIGAKTVTPSNTCDEISSNGLYATNSYPLCKGSAGAANDDVWFKFIATSNSHFISVNPNDKKYDPVVQIFTGCNPTQTAKLNSCFDASFPMGKYGDTLVTGLTPNTLYYYRVYDINATNQDTMTFTTCVTNVVANDDCLGALKVNSSATCDPVMSDALYASQSLPATCGGKPNDDVWFTFKATKATEFITVTPDDSNYDPVVEVFKACGTVMTPAICEDTKFAKGTFGTVAVKNLTVGTDYFYRVYDKNTTNQDTMKITTCVVESIVNDSCAFATPITISSSQSSTNGDGTYATMSLAGCTSTATDDVWYTFTATANETVNISVTPSKDYDPVVQVFANTCPTASSSSVICENDAYLKGKFGMKSLSVTNGTKYFYRVYNATATNSKVYPYSFTTAVNRVPSNDNCTDATPLTVNATCIPTDGDLTFATKSLNAGLCSSSSVNDVWYSFTATATTQVIGIEASEDFDPIVELYPTTCPTTSTLSAIKCEDNRFSPDGYGTWNVPGLTIGTTYKYRIYNGASTVVNPQTFKTCVTTVPSAPSNDNPCSPTSISHTPTLTTDFKTYTNESATSTIGVGIPAPGCANYVGSDVWFKTKVPFSGQLTFETKKMSMLDGGMAIYRGGCKSMSLIKCDDNGAGTMSKISLTALNPGDSIFVRIWGKGITNNGTFGLSIVKGEEPSLNPPCVNLDFESNKSGWFGTYGGGSANQTDVAVITGGTNDLSPKYIPQILNTTSVPEQFEVMTGGIDQYGGFPKVFNGVKSLRLGVDYANKNPYYNNGRSIEQYFQVTKDNNYFIYNYAAVLATGTNHPVNQQPFFKVEFFDDFGLPIGCGDYLVAAPPTGKSDKIGFNKSPNSTEIINYKPWTTIGVDLTNYIGQNIHVRFTSGSCNSYGHFGYVYLDCSCKKFEIEKPENVCLGDSARLYGPKGALSYLWKDAGGTVISTADSAVFKTLITGKSTYTCEVTMFGTTMCKSILTTEIEVGNKPTLKITDPDTVCANNTVDITKSNVTLGSTTGLVYSYFKDDQTTHLTNQTAIDVSGTYYIKGEKSATCKDIKPVKVVINPTPKIADKTAVICSDDSVKLVPLFVATDVIPADTKYKWTIDANSSNITGQSNEAIGKSDIKNKLSNKVNTAQKIKYKITPFTPTCEGTPFYFEITVNPKPQIKDSTSSICTNTPFNIAPINLRANVVPAGTTYTWIFKENTNVTNESNSAADESAIKSYAPTNLINTTNTIQPVEHRVAPKSGSCVGDTFKIIINVNPAPKIPDSLKSICTNTAFDITPVHTGTRFIIPSGTTYTWANPTLSGAIVGGSAQTNQTTISQTLINNTTTNQTATYLITANSNTLPNCSSTFNGVITVEPKIKPVITCGTSSSTTLEFTWADIPAATSYEYVYKVGATGTLSSPPQSISAGISPRTTSTTITGLSAGNNVYFTLTPIGILCPLPETKICSNCAQPTIVNTVTTTPTDFEICIGETITLKASEVPTNTNQWSIVTNNIVSNTINSSKDLMDITGLKAGTTDIEFKNNTGCVNSISVTVNPKPEIAKIIKSICYGGLFDTIPNNNILTSNVVPTGTTYTWALPATSVSDVTGITTGTAEASFKQNLTNGTNVSKVIDYKVKATSGVAPNSCTNNFDVSVKLNPTPKIAAITKILCSTDAFDTIPNNTFLSTNIVPSGTTYTWDLPTLLSGINGATAENTNTKTSFKQTLTNTTTNPINVSYSVTAKSGSIPDQCTSTFNTTLTVNPTPKIDNITLAICSEETFDTIPDNSNPNSIPTGTKYTWNIGLPPTGISGITAGTDQSSIKQKLKNTTSNPIDVVYTITATSGVVPNQCSKTFTLTATVNPIPKVITVDTIKICENIKNFNQFNLNETGGIASKWEWSSNLTTSLAIIDNKTTTNPSVKNGINGEAFKVIGTDINGCKNSDTTILKILPLPIFTPSVDTACVNGKLTFKAKLPSQLNYPTYSWTYANGTTTNNLETFSIDPVSIVNAGKYYISVTDVNSCTKKDSISATIYPLPVFTPSYTLPCENKPLILRSNYKKGVSYVWTGPNTFTHNSIIDSVNITTIAIPATHTGDYFVEITDTNKCVKKEKVSVIIYPKPKVTATNSGPICANVTSFTLDETATDAISWNWSSNRFAKFNKSLEQPLVTLASDGEIFKVVGKDINGCIDSATTTLIINPIPVITPKEVCVDKQVILTATHIPATSNAWKSENVGIATIDPLTGEMLGIAAGKGKIVYLDDKGCSDTSIVTINALPKITTSPLEVCEESTLQLKANHTAAPLNSWKSSVPSFATISNIGLVQGIKTGVSSIEFTDSKGCTTKEDLAVNIKPIANFKAVYESICVTDTLFLIDKSKPLSHKYIWSFGDGLSSNKNTHKYLTGGIFDITLVTITDKGCMDTMTKNKYIEVIGLPKVTFSFTPDSIDIFDPQIRFMNHSNAKHYEWVFGDGLPISVQENPIHTFPATTGQHYTVTLTGYNTENGCSTSYSQMIVAKEPLIYYIPNTFTPNGDEFNNVFKPVFYSGLDVYNYHFTIYNRWGEVIFESFNVDFGWDGTYGNQIEETATYIWKLEFKEKNKENTHSKTGHVNVLR